MDGELSTWTFCRADGTPIGWIFDDTTPNLDDWIDKAKAKRDAEHPDWIVVVLIAPDRMGKHYAGCVCFFEAYWKCCGITVRQWLGQIVRYRRNHYAGYVVQKYYGWQDSGGSDQCVPTTRQYWILRHGLAALRPKYGIWDF